MIQSLFDNSTIPLLAKSAAFAERRHEVLSGNIANISTPDYRTRDLPVADFQKALREAIAQRQTPGRAANDNWSFASSRARPTEQLFPERLMRPIEAPPKSLTFQDGNNRSIEHEAMELTKNSLMQQVAIELMGIQMNRLQAVISERP
jgi:flagellar basal-body rod protein FlgB